MHSYFKNLIQVKTTRTLCDIQYEELETLYTYLINRPHILNIRSIALDLELTDLKVNIYLDILSKLEIIKQENNYIHVYNYSLLPELEHYLIYAAICNIPNVYYLNNYQKILITAFICSDREYIEKITKYIEDEDNPQIINILWMFSQIIK